LIFILVFLFDEIPEIGNYPDIQNYMIIEKVKSVLYIINIGLKRRGIIV